MDHSELPLPNADSVLVVDDSRAMRELLLSLLGQHFERVSSAASCKQAIQSIDAQPDLRLVICEMQLRDGEGLEVLDHVRALAGERPAVILTTSRWNEKHAAAATARDARGYLAKPISLSEIRLCLRISPEANQRVLGARRRGLAYAWIKDPDCGQFLLSFAVHDISETGALLETKGPLPIGTRMELELALGTRRVGICARVVRVQEPQWMAPGGVAVVFERVDAPAMLAAFVDETSPSRPSGPGVA